MDLLLSPSRNAGKCVLYAIAAAAFATILATSVSAQDPTPEPTGAPSAPRNDSYRATAEISRTSRGKLKTWCLAVVVTVCETLGPKSEGDGSKPSADNTDLAVLTPPDVFAKARALEKAGNLPQAKRHYEHYLAIAPKGPHAKDSKRGVARINPHLEMRAYDARRDRASNDVEVGDYYAGTKNFKAALARYRHALEIDPNNDAARFRIAGVLETIGRLSEAREHYAAYLEQHPKGEFAAACKRALTRLPETSPPTSAPAETPPSKR